MLFLLELRLLHFTDLVKLRILIFFFLLFRGVFGTAKSKRRTVIEKLKFFYKKRKKSVVKVEDSPSITNKVFKTLLSAKKDLI